MTSLQRVLESQRDKAYAALRILAGLMFAFHGVQKLFGLWTTHVPPVGSQLWVGGVIEFVGGSLIAFGAFTTWAAFLASGTMAVAYIQYHWKFRFRATFFPALNDGELAIVYCLVFLFIACAGSGMLSIDGILAGRSRRSVGSIHGHVTRSSASVD